MKPLKLLFIVISIYGQKLYSQIAIPDGILKSTLLNASPTNPIAFDVNENPIAIDIDIPYGEISQTEASNVYKLDLGHSLGNRIVSIEGLQYFNNLKSLNLYDHNISNPSQLYALSNTLDILDISMNRGLENQNLDFNGTNLSGLISFKAFGIGLSTINISGLNNLKVLDLSYNLFTSIDLRGCRSLTNINVSTNRYPNLPNSGISTLTYSIGDLLNVTTFNVSANRLSTIPIQLADLPSLQTLYINQNELTSLDVSSSYNLVKLVCNDNNISSINFGSINQLQDLTCHNNYLTNLNISNFLNLRDLSCSYNQLSTLDASTNSKLLLLSCSNNNLSSMILKNNGPFLIEEAFSFANNPNLNYVCEDANQISLINSLILQYGYTGVTVNSNCGIILSINAGYEPASASISTYPNPVKKGEKLYITAVEPLQGLTIYNNNGQIVYTVDRDLNEITTTGLTSGMYLIKIQTSKNIITKKMVIE